MDKVDEPLNIMGFSSAWTMVEVLKRAGKNLTREGFIKAAETMKDFDIGLSVPQTWTPTRRDGGRSGIMCKAKKGNWVRLTGWIGGE